MEPLASSVDGAFGDLNNQTERPPGFAPGALDILRQQGDAFARAGFDKGAGGFGTGHPGFLVLFAGIPLGDEVEGATPRRPAVLLVGLHEQKGLY